MLANSTSAVDSPRPGASIALRLLGALRFIVTCLLSWNFVSRLMPIDKPIGNGLQLLFSILIVLSISLPSVLIGLGLVRCRARAIASAVQLDILVIALCAMFLLLGMRSRFADCVIGLSAIDAIIIAYSTHRRTTEGGSDVENGTRENACR